MASPAAAPVECSNPECRVAETGKCVEGKATSECAQYGKPRELQGTSKVKAQARHFGVQTDSCKPRPCR